MSFRRPIQRSLYNIFDPEGLKVLTCQTSGFGHLNPLSANQLTGFYMRATLALNGLMSTDFDTIFKTV